jgi:hypothetical protein
MTNTQTTCRHCSEEIYRVGLQWVAADSDVWQCYREDYTETSAHEPS